MGMVNGGRFAVVVEEDGLDAEFASGRKHPSASHVAYSAVSASPDWLKFLGRSSAEVAVVGVPVVVAPITVPIRRRAPPLVAAAADDDDDIACPEHLCEVDCNMGT